MQYLGRISGSGLLTCNGETIARAHYDIEGFYRKPARVTAAGEVRLTAAVLKQLIGRNDIKLLTDDGRVLDLGFVRTASAGGNAAQVDVTGGLPEHPGHWRQ